MRKVDIEYNPFKLITRITVDNKQLKQNSRLQKFVDKRLQEWVDELPGLLFDEYRTREFEFTFLGTNLDYEDLQSVVEEANKQGYRIRVAHIPAKEVKDREKVIARIFAEVQQGPFAELRDPAVKHAFEQANNSEFEVDVIATMSSGKSTLINALLGQKLMPAKQAACTATITEVKDNDADHFEATVFDKAGKVLKKQTKLTYAEMRELNSDPEVSKIHVEGDIPFLKAEGMALVLVDTPGPNSSRNPEHKQATIRMIKESSKPLVLYVMNCSQQGTNDDSNLLNMVAESMKVGGRQSRDRFIFVVNKVDELKDDENETPEETLENAKDYLKKFGGIEDANIYLASALTALDIRTILADSGDYPSYVVNNARSKVDKFNEAEHMHLEKLAPLPASIRRHIEDRLAEAIRKGDKRKQALIHSGIVPLEEAIKVYVLKYARTAKIRNVVDTFQQRLESAQSFERVKKEIASREKDRAVVGQKINLIMSKIQSGEEAKKFNAKIDAINFDEEIKEGKENILKEAQSILTDYFTLSVLLNTTESGLLPAEDGKKLISDFSKLANFLAAKVKVELENLIKINVQKSAEELLRQYKEKLTGLTEEIKVGDIKLDPFQLMQGEITYDPQDAIEHRREIKNPFYYLAFPLFCIDYFYKKFTEDVEYMNMEILSNSLLAPVEAVLREHCDAAEMYAKNQTEGIKEQFREKFADLDRLLGVKLAELQDCLSDAKKAEDKRTEAERRLEWLKGIQRELDAVLEI